MTASWTQRAKLLATDGAAGDEFGWSVTLDGNTVVVGAPKGASIGSAYVFASLPPPSSTSNPSPSLSPRISTSPAVTGNAVAVDFKYFGATVMGDKVFFAPSFQRNVGMLDMNNGVFSTIATTGASVSSAWKYCEAVAMGADKVFFAPYGQIKNVGVLDNSKNVVTTIAATSDATSSNETHCRSVMVGNRVFGYACPSSLSCNNGPTSQ